VATLAAQHQLQHPPHRIPSRYSVPEGWRAQQTQTTAMHMVRWALAVAWTVLTILTSLLGNAKLGRSKATVRTDHPTAGSWRGIAKLPAASVLWTALQPATTKPLVEKAGWHWHQHHHHRRRLWPQSPPHHYWHLQFMVMAMAIVVVAGMPGEMLAAAACVAGR